jgi:hypothetical protein
VSAGQTVPANGWNQSGVFNLGAGSTVNSTAICLANGTGCPSTTAAISGMTTGQVPIAATATTVTSSKALAGSGAGITTGPTSSTSGDLMSLTGTGGQAADSGIAASNVPLLNATNTFTAAQTIYGSTARLYLQSSSGTSDVWYTDIENSTQRWRLVNNTSGNGEILSVLRSGYVGIDTVNPGRALDVTGDIHYTANMFGNNASGIFFNGAGSYGSGVFSDSGGTILYLQSGSNPRMTLLSNGNVGIGTPSPGTNLVVQGAANTDAPGTLNVVATGDANNTNLIGAFQSSLATGHENWINWGVVGTTNNAASLGFYYAGAGSTSNRVDFAAWGAYPMMSMLAGGKVSIGDTTATSMFNVGTANQFQVTSTGVSSAGAGSTDLNGSGVPEAHCLADGTGCGYVRGTLSLTTATSDTASITGVTSSSVCTFSPTNATAAAATVIAYVSAVSTGSVTITHAATVANGGTLNIICTTF